VVCRDKFASDGDTDLGIIVYIPFDKRKDYVAAEAYEAVKRELPQATIRPVRFSDDALELPGSIRRNAERPQWDSWWYNGLAGAMREQCRQDFLQGDWDWCCFIDSDCIVGPGFGALLPKDERIVTAIYPSRGGNTIIAFESVGQPFTREQLLAKGNGAQRAEVAWTGMGATFIPARALQVISWDDYKPAIYRPEETGEDGFFCMAAAEVGIHTYADWSVKVVHVEDTDLRAYWLDKELNNRMGKSAKKVTMLAKGVRYLSGDSCLHPVLGECLRGQFKVLEDEALRQAIGASRHFELAEEDIEVAVPSGEEVTEEVVS
jgi:hypothetical protein